MFKLAWIHVKRYFKNPILLLMMGPIPLALILASMFLGGNNESFDANVAFVLERNRTYENELLKNLQINEKYIYHNDETAALNELKANKVAGVIILPESFSTDLKNGQKPSIILYKTSKAAGTAETELKIEDQINTWLKEYYGLSNFTPITTSIDYKEHPVDMTVTMFVIMNIYFMFIGASVLAKDVYQLKQQKVLHRTLSTANKDYKIFGGIILAMCLIQGFCFTIVYYIGMFILDVTMPNAFLPLLLMFSMSFVASSLVIFITRIFKHSNMIELSLIMYTLVGFILSLTLLSPLDIGLDIDWLTNLAKLFPIYWAFDTALNFELWPNLFIIFLFGMVFLSAGSFKLKNFIQS